MKKKFWQRVAYLEIAARAPKSVLGQIVLRWKWKRRLFLLYHAMSVGAARQILVFCL